MNIKKIILAGSMDQQTMQFLREFLNGFEISGNSDFNTFDFSIENFKECCNRGFNYIFCVETLNPRPVTLNEDLKILSSLFKPEILRERLVILFVQKGGFRKSLNEIREIIIDKFNVLFKYLDISNPNERTQFAQDKIWLVENNEIFSSFLRELQNKEIKLYPSDMIPESDSILNPPTHLLTSDPICTVKTNQTAQKSSLCCFIL